MLRHDPAGFSLYEPTGFSRRPYLPTVGEQVHIRCKMTEDDAREPVLRLHGPDGETRHLPVKDRSYGEDSYVFRIGPFTKPGEYRYTFEGEHDAVYTMDVVEEVSVTATDCTMSGDDEVLWHCRLGSEHSLRMICRIGDDNLCWRIDGTGAQTVPPSPSINGSTIRRRMADRFTLTADASGIAIEDEDEELVRIELSALRVKRDARGRIRGLNWKINGRGDALYGLGEKFNRVNQLGLTAKSIVYEKFTYQAEHTYLPVPWVFSPRGWGLFYDTSAPMLIDLRRQADGLCRMITEMTWDPDEESRFHLLLGEPGTLLKMLQDRTGRAELPPTWAFGPWISANGWATQEEAAHQLEQLKKYEIPATVMVLEAWSDESTFYIWNGAEYTARSDRPLRTSDFTFPEDGPWPDPLAFARDVEDAGLNLILWQIPVIPGPDDERRAQNIQLTIDREDAIEKGYCVRHQDGRPYCLPDLWFGGSLLFDFSNPEAVAWWMEKRRYLLDDFGVKGFKTDGGEFVYDPTLRFYEDRSGLTMRNRYPACYTQAYYDYLQAQAGSGVCFSRAGYAGSQSRPLHWAGDQATTFSEMRSQIVAGLSAGLSGVLFWGFDIGGFSGPLPTSDFYLRSAAFGTFCPIMQFHSEPRSGQYGGHEGEDWNNDRSPWNIARVNDDPTVISAYKRLADIRMHLMPYLYREARHSVETARPLMAHLILDSPQDARVLNIEDQYMLGRDLLVAPVVEADADGRMVYLPEGHWWNIWTGEDTDGGRKLFVESPTGEIPVFSRCPDLTVEALMSS